MDTQLILELSAYKDKSVQLFLNAGLRLSFLAASELPSELKNGFQTLLPYPQELFNQFRMGSTNFFFKVLR